MLPASSDNAQEIFEARTHDVFGNPLLLQCKDPIDDGPRVGEVLRVDERVGAQQKLQRT